MHRSFSGFCVAATLVPALFAPLPARATAAEQLLEAARQQAERGDLETALESYQKALAAFRDRGDRLQEAAILVEMAFVRYTLDRYEEATRSLASALEIVRALGDRENETFVLEELGFVHRVRGRGREALAFYQQAADLQVAAGDRAGFANTSNQMGIVYSELGEHPEAIATFERALEIYEELGAAAEIAKVLNNIGSIYNALGEYPQAIAFHERALDGARAAEELALEAAALNNLGLIYDNLGETDRALGLYREALERFRETSDRAAESTALNNIGAISYRREDYEAALDNYWQSLEIAREMGNRSQEEIVLNNLGLISEATGQHEKALQFHQQSLEIAQSLGRRASEGQSLNNVARTHASLGKPETAFANYGRALVAFREVGDRVGESDCLKNIARLLESREAPELAILFYKQSVTVAEGIRRGLRGLDRSLQASFTETVAENYRELARLLLSQNRPIEGQQVLDLLKIQELSDFFDADLEEFDEPNTGNDTHAASNIIFLATEREIWQAIDANLTDGTDLQRRVESETVERNVAELRQQVRAERLDLAYLDRLLEKLQGFERKTALLYPLVLDDRVGVALVLPDRPPVRRWSEYDRNRLQEAVTEYRSALTHPLKRRVANIARTYGQLFHKWLIAPIAEDLEAAGIETIVYAPDGPLRYIPLAALHDGDRWLVERYAIDNITASTLLEPSDRNVAEGLRVLAAAFAEGSHRFQVGDTNFFFDGLPLPAAR